MSNYSKKLIAIRIALDGDSFDSSNNVIYMTDHRCSFSIQSFSGSTGSFASDMHGTIYGMRDQDMNKLSTLGYAPGTYRKNQIQIFAGDSYNMSQVFSGIITYGIVQRNNMPDVGVDIVASALAQSQYSAIAGSSYQGTMDVATMLQGIASNAGWSFANSGVTAKLSNHAVGGDPIHQVKDICNAAGVNASLDNGVLTIWPAGSYRTQDTLLINSANGMVGYPEYIVGGIQVRSIFNPDVQVGNKVTVQSDAPDPSPNAPQGFGGQVAGFNGDFYTWGVTHEISCETPDGPWFTTLRMGATKFNAR